MLRALVEKLFGEIFRDSEKQAPPNGFKVQTLIFDKEKFSEKSDASKWAKDHDFKSSSITELEDSFHIRQLDQDDFKRIRTITLTEGVKAMGGPLKKSKSITILEKNKQAYLLTNFEVKGGTKTKALDQDEPVIISGIANKYEEDRMREVVDPSGVDLRSFFDNPVLLFQHNHSEAIGTVISMRAEEDGLHFEAEVGNPKKAPLTQRQKDVRSLIAQGILKTVSIGFIPKEIQPPTFDDQGAVIEPMTIKKSELLELSVVAVPANAGALFDMKSFTKQLQDFSEVAKTVIVKTSSKEKLDLTEDQMEELEKLLKEMLDIAKSIHTDVKKNLEMSENFQKALDKLESPGKGSKPDDEDEDEEDKKEMEKKLEKLTDTVTELAEAIGKFIAGNSEEE